MNDPDLTYKVAQLEHIVVDQDGEEAYAEDSDEEDFYEDTF